MSCYALRSAPSKEYAAVGIAGDVADCFVGFAVVVFIVAVVDVTSSMGFVERPVAVSLSGSLNLTLRPYLNPE